MKKIVSIVCTLVMVLGIVSVGAVGASAAEPAKTEIKVAKDDEITYTLTLGGIDEPVVGCDFSVYYDADLFDKISIADFNDNTNQDDWVPMINPDLDGEVIGNWSILSGVDFSKERNFLTVKFKAKKDGTGHISYFIRYLYDNNIFNSDDRPQITNYKFTCTVLKNGDPVVEKAQPELNTSEEQDSGLFVNSVTGDSNDADANIPGTVVKKNNTNSNITPGGSNNSDDQNATAQVNNEEDSDDNQAPAGNEADNTPENEGDNKPDDSAQVEENNDGEAQVVNNVAEKNNEDDANNNEVKAADDKKADDKKSAAEEKKAEATTGADQAKATVAEDKTPAAAADGSASVGAENSEQTAGGISPVVWIIIALVILGGGGAAAYFYIRKKPAKSDAADSEDADSEAEE